MQLVLDALTPDWVDQVALLPRLLPPKDDKDYKDKAFSLEVGLLACCPPRMTRIRPSVNKCD